MDPTRLMTLDATVTFRTVTSRDVYGDDVLTGTTATVKCWLHQTERRESPLGNVTEQTWTAYFPPDAALDANDRFTVEGSTFEVIGPPGKFTNPRTQHATHLEVTARIVT